MLLYVLGKQYKYAAHCAAGWGVVLHHTLFTQKPLHRFQLIEFNCNAKPRFYQRELVLSIYASSATSTMRDQRDQRGKLDRHPSGGGVGGGGGPRGWWVVVVKPP